MSRPTLKEIQEKWEYIPNISSHSYWLSDDEMYSRTVSPEEILSRGVEIEAENERLKDEAAELHANEIGERYLREQAEQLLVRLGGVVKAAEQIPCPPLNTGEGRQEWANLRIALEALALNRKDSAYVSIAKEAGRWWVKAERDKELERLRDAVRRQSEGQILPQDMLDTLLKETE